MASPDQDDAMRKKLDDAIQAYKAEVLPDASSSSRMAKRREIWLSLPAIPKWQVPAPFWLYILLADQDCSDECLWGIADAFKGGARGAAVDPEYTKKGELLGQDYMFVTGRTGVCTNCDEGPSTQASMINVTSAIEKMVKAGPKGPAKRFYIVAQDCKGNRTCRAEVGGATLQVEESNGVWTPFDIGKLPLCLKKLVTGKSSTE